MSVDWCRDIAVTIREVSTLMNNIFPDRTIANVRFTVCVLSSTICRGPTEFSKNVARLRVHPFTNDEVFASTLPGRNCGSPVTCVEHFTK